VSARSRAPSSSRQLFARRARARRWAILRRVLMLLLVAALVAGAGWLVFVSSVLAVEGVRVSGLRILPADRVTRVAAVPLGEPLARVDVDRVRARVERLPAVERADIGRSWPHTVSIKVTERTPVAAVRAGSGYRLVDAEGVTFRAVGTPHERLPVMTVGGPPQAGLGPSGDAATEAAAVVDSLPRPLVRRVERVEAGTMDSIVLHLRDGRRVVWGSAENSALKARVLTALLPRSASVYDVSVPGSPTLQVD
jgi:cell division protein FtsQ